MMPMLRLLSRLVGILLLAGIPPLASYQDARDAADAAKLIEVLEIRAGETVADVGAGGGLLVPAMSRHLGPAGRLYATDVNADRLAEIRKLVASQSLPNVTVLQGADAETSLPAACCDAIFMRLVYHHFGDPPAMNASLLRSLKPGGRIAILDFAPKSKASAPPGKRGEGDAHGVMPATVIEELKAAGFVDVREVPWPEPTLAVVGRRPEK
ncbi:MAG TPA: methyltransferase domain-containing protein [Vicinamibacterales bacterium]|nr:methyltransferase domain-containing protein [Vicinamibacterales bacterium]